MEESEKTKHEEHKIQFEPFDFSTWLSSLFLAVSSPRNFFKTQTFYYPYSEALALQAVAITLYTVMHGFKTHKMNVMAIVMAIALSIASVLFVAGGLWLLQKLWHSTGGFRKYLSFISFGVFLYCLPACLLAVLTNSMWASLTLQLSFAVWMSYGFYCRFKPGKIRYVVSICSLLLLPFMIALLVGLINNAASKARLAAKQNPPVDSARAPAMKK